MVGWISLGNDRSVHTTVRAGWGWACADPPLSPAPIGSDSIRAVDGPLRANAEQVSGMLMP